VGNLLILNDDRIPAIDLLTTREGELKSIERLLMQR
jgi:hypothetical protein